ncbi:carbohydrate porin [Erwinia sp. Eh17-17]|uniref:carbohydrate porin n=1 Tax=Erwinia sp. Eh17-17 TaxID=3080330 RepID=UPI00320A5787
MERKSHPQTYRMAAALAALLTVASAFAAPQQRPLPPSAQAEIITPEQQIPSIPEEYHSSHPQPLMRGEGFNYNLYYNFQLTPHVILRPNLQQSTKPGAVDDDSHRFVGGLSAGINF